MFTQFSNYLDDEMQRSLRFGEILMNILRQEQYNPWEEWEQAFILTAATAHSFDNLSDDGFEQTLRKMTAAFKAARPDIVSRLSGGEKISEQDRSDIAEFARSDREEA